MSEMSAVHYAVLHLRFKVQVSPDVFLTESRKAAASIASVDGLIWKIWVLQRDDFEVGGIYLFASRETAEAYLTHPAIEAVRSNPVVVATESQLWDVESSLSAVTRAPLGDVRAQYSEPDVLVAGGR